ncbi:endospore germination permease [Cohnella mopanensis]|uniref:endospore germination permease n=1 Tax=Cohnella mopanensis TaxID=2911966 RepID=UPI001EF82017|nr:endospore germination permease [Cohnella mopanensis]
MTASGDKINFLQTGMILLLMNGLTNHVTINPMLLDAAGRDSWISVLTTGILFIPWCLLLLYIMRKSGQQKLQPWLAERTHPIVAWVLTIPLYVQLLMIGWMTVVHTVTWTITNYLPMTPKLVLALVLVIPCALFAIWGIRVIAIAAGFFLPIVVLLGIFASVTNIPEKNYSLLKPYVEHGWNPVWDGMLYAGGGFVELIVLVAMQHRLQKKIRVFPLLLYAIFSIYIMLGPLIGAITEFGPLEAAKQMVSPYEQWRLVKIGNYIEHVDFFSIYQWLAGASIRISMSIFLLVDFLPPRQIKHKNKIVWLIALAFILSAMLKINEYSFYLWMYRYYFPISLTIALSVSLVWFIVSLIVKPNRGGAS